MKLPRKPPDFNKILANLNPKRLPEILSKVSGPTYKGKYLHWDELWNRGAPEGLSHEEWWFTLKGSRTTFYKKIPLQDKEGKTFQFANTEQAQQSLHEITQRASGSVGVSDLVTNPDTRNRYLIRNLMEEGIASSLLEGAATTREKAKEMIQKKRKPKSEGERMVMNNYAAMQYIINLDKVPLTPEIIFQLHVLITQDTLENSEAVGHLRNPGEVVVVDPKDNTILHIPPPAVELRKRMKAMCDFANGKTPKGFVHPVVRSILLHFWLAYDHPFVDGNGRTARALFYWSMLQHNYWLFEFISISTIIYGAPTKYANAFLYSETDGNDMTYFLLHQLDVIEKAINSLHQYLDDKMAQRKKLESQLQLGILFNYRQLDLISHALRNPNARYDIRQHQYKFDIVYQTARTDLLKLADHGILVMQKIGKTMYFSPAIDMENKLSTLASKDNYLPI